jgi:hypothetical protein
MYSQNWSDEYLQRYRKDGDTYIIEISLQDPFNLYDDKDPSPLKVRDLKPILEQYIFNCLREIPNEDKVRIEFYFYEPPQTQEEKDLLKKSVKDFFSYRCKVRFLDFRLKIKYGLRSTLIGLIFLFFCIYISSVYLKNQNDIVGQFFLEGLSVLGWVSLWNPVQVFLYEIWPILTSAKILRKCSQVEYTFNSINPIAEERRYIDP